MSIEDRIRARATELREQAERLRIHAETQITALLTAAAELDALLKPEEPADGAQE